MKPGKIFSVGALSLAIFTTSLMPAEAVTMPSAKAQISAVEQVQWRRDRRGWYHGHRGYRERRPGYRRHRDGFWYPLAAFGAGAIIGGAMTAPPRAYRAGDRHIRWCTERYRTYRASDNTYVVRAGVRAQCYSPYD